MAKLTIVRGVSGSGKSTWARQQNAKVVSRDDLRELLFPGEDAKSYYEVPSEVFAAREQEVTIAQDAMVAAFLKAGKDVVVDNTNIQWKFVKALAKIGYRYGAEVEVKVFDVPLTVALDRNHNRAYLGGRDVKREIIEKQYASFQKNKSMTLDPVQPVVPYTGTPGKPKAFMVDIDGTLAHMRDYRGPFEWHNVGKDDVDQTVADIVWDIWAGSQERSNGRYDVIVMSGRDESCRGETARWLDHHAIPYERLFMRPEGDMRPDNIVKAELFDNYVRDKYDVQFVLDDRDQVVEMWRRMGIKTLQVEPGDF